MRAQDYITLVRNYNRAIWDNLNALEAMQNEWNALDYGTTLDDGEGQNEGITKTEVGAVVFASADALRTALAGGVATNMAKLL